MKKRDEQHLLAAFGLLLLAGFVGFVSQGTITGHQVAAFGEPTQSPLGNAIEFFRAFGFFDVVLPFLLVFAIVFGILEKTKVFGVEKTKDSENTRKNLNAMVAFAIAFFVVGAKSIVGIIAVSMPTISLFLVMIIAFLLLVGAFVGEEQLKMVDKFPKITKWFIALIFVGMIAVFLAAVGWLDAVIGFLAVGLSGTLGVSILFIALMGGAVYLITHKKSGGS